jgi:sigma-B regulation protein RsbU (phosphoserine phosphatase)
LNPLRRALFVLAVILIILPKAQAPTNIPTHDLGILVLLLILMLELKDKLLAHDELASGRAVQNALKPEENPRIENWEVWLFSRSANEVGGDLIDVLELEDGAHALAVGDVAGKGLAAALFMARLQATLRAIAPKYPALGDLGNELNAIFCRDGLPERFVSLLYAKVSPRSGRIRFLNAGHLPPYILRRDGIAEGHKGEAALGLTPASRYREHLIDLDPGDVFFAYSDGLTEARDTEGEFFGESRLIRSLEKLRSGSAQEIGRGCLAEVDRFSLDSRFTDDLSLFVLKRMK